MRAFTGEAERMKYVYSAFAFTLMSGLVKGNGRTWRPMWIDTGSARTPGLSFFTEDKPVLRHM